MERFFCTYDLRKYQKKNALKNSRRFLLYNNYIIIEDQLELKQLLQHCLYIVQSF